MSEGGGPAQDGAGQSTTKVLGGIIMDKLMRRKTAGAYSCTVLDLERARIRHQFHMEQKKLEDMVAASFLAGQVNMGADSLILKQSNLLDKLVVNEMELEQNNGRYYKDRLCD